MRLRNTIPWLAIAVLLPLSGCVSTGGRNMETVVTDMHQRVTMLDKDLEPSLAKLNANAAALIQRVNENERQVRLLTSLVEENQHKLDKLLQMLSDLRTTLYRHWGLSLTPAPVGASNGGGIQIVPPTQGGYSGASDDRPDAAAPPVTPPTPKTDDNVEQYVEAKALYDDEDYSGAQLAFDEFLKKYPLSSQAHKAQFWLGKSFLKQSQYARAIRAFEGLRRDFPDSSYMAFALHNQAVAHYNIGERNEAIALMEAVVANYPTSAAAEDAESDLKQLRERR